MKFPPPTQSTFTPVSAGTHLAICYRVIDLGTNESRFGTKRTLMLGWEIPGETRVTDEGVEKPLIISKFYRFSMHVKSNLRKDLEAWKGRTLSDNEIVELDTRDLLGKACLIGVAHEQGDDGAIKARIINVQAPLKGMTVPEGFNEHQHFGLTREDFDAVVLDALPDGLKKQITGSPEYRALKEGVATNGAGPEAAPHDEDGVVLDDEIPF